MPKVELPGGHAAVIGLRMAEFRELWNSGAVKKMQAMSDADADFAAIYPILAKSVRSWDCTDLDGQALDPQNVASYDELEPGMFMKLMQAVSAYIGGEEAKN